MTDSTEVKKDKTKKKRKKKYQVVTYLKNIYLEKKTMIIKALNEDEAIEIFIKIQDEQLEADTFRDDIEVLDSVLPPENISPIWIEKMGTKMPDYDPFDETLLDDYKKMEEEIPKINKNSKRSGSCGLHGNGVELWLGCNHILKQEALNIAFSRDVEGDSGVALCFNCESVSKNWTRKQFADSVKTICRGCLQDIVKEMIKFKTKEQIDQMFFGLEDL